MQKFCFGSVLFLRIVRRFFKFDIEYLDKDNIFALKTEAKCIE